MSPFKNICITGMGIVTAHGCGTKIFMENLVVGRCAYTIDQLPLERRQTLVTQTALLCVEEAMQQAKLFPSSLSSDRIGLVVGGHNLNQNFLFEQFQAFAKDPMTLLPSYAVQFMDTDLVGLISEKFSITGDGCTVGGASASGNMAIIHACRALQLGLVDVCVVVGALTDLSPLELNAFERYGALSLDKICRPFDQAHNGFAYGQASGCLVLESEASTHARGIPRIGKILGTGVALDAHRFAEPNSSGQVSAMRKALQQAEIGANQIDYINTHGTGSILGDETEVQSMETILAGCTNHVWLNATKSITGHTLCAAGVIEAIATLIQMQNDFVHPNPLLENPIINSLNFVGKTSIQTTINYALSNSYGIGGINTSIVLAK